MYSGALIEKMGALEMRLTRGYYRLFDNTVSYFQSVRGVCGLKCYGGGKNRGNQCRESSSTTWS